MANDLEPMRIAPTLLRNSVQRRACSGLHLVVMLNLGLRRSWVEIAW